LAECGLQALVPAARDQTAVRRDRHARRYCGSRTAHQNPEYEGLFGLRVPLRREAMRSLMLSLIGWYNEHRPHTTLKGTTPNEIYFKRFPANRKAANRTEGAVASRFAVRARCR